MSELKMCSVPGCILELSRKKYSKLCEVHLYRWDKYKSYEVPEHVRPVEVPEGFAKVCKVHGNLKEDRVGKGGRCLECVKQHAQKMRDKYPEKIKESNLKQKARKEKMIAELGEFKPKKRSEMRKEIQLEKTCKKHGLLDRKDIVLRDGGYLRCRLCRSEMSNDYRKRHPEQTKEIGRRGKIKRSVINCERVITKKFDITKEEYYKLIDEHNNKCAICKQPETKVTRRDGTVNALSIDHSHKTGKIRGLLCHACNSGIGLLKDSENVLQSAIEYLRRANGD